MIPFTHTLLPESAQAMLKDAAKIQGAGTQDEAIDAVIARLRVAYPDKFRALPVVNRGEK